MKCLTGLGWSWCENGVMLCVALDGGQKQCVFVPLNRVWHEFHKELSAVGYPFPPSVGGQISVGGLFSGISHALSSAAHSVTHAVSKAASGVAHTAENYAKHAASLAKGVVQNKYFRSALDAAAFACPALAPAAAAMEVANKAIATVQNGIHAAQQIQAGIHTAANVAAAAAGLNAKAAMHAVIAKAHAGDKTAQQLVGAFQKHMAARAPAPRALTSAKPGHRAFRPRYHTQPAVSGPFSWGSMFAHAQHQHPHQSYTGARQLSVYNRPSPFANPQHRQFALYQR